MNKQMLLFDNRETKTENKYTSKIKTPVYEPKHQKPHLLKLCDQSKTKALIAEIDNSELPEDEKEFLRAAAWRHAVFHYERIADYYAHSSLEMQRLIERSALVIIDFDDCIERGYVKLCESIKREYLEEYDCDDHTS